MAEKYGFFNAELSGETYDRVYDAGDFADYFSSFISNGVFAEPTDTLKVTAGSGLSVSISSGRGFCKGYFYNNTAALTKELSAASGTQYRIDLVVLKLNLTDRTFLITVKTGSYAASKASASVPELTRDTSIYELGIAKIAVDAGAVSLTSADITDLRDNESYCGRVKGIVDQRTDVDTALSGTSTNPVQNKVVKSALDYKASTNHTHTVVNGHTVNSDVPSNAKFTDTTYGPASVTANGLMASTDKAKLNGIDENANNYTHPSTHPASMITGLPSSLPASDVPTWAKASTKPTYTKSEIGLGNVDNTADSSKSVANSVKWNGKTISIIAKSSLPETKNANTIYFAY